MSDKLIGIAMEHGSRIHYPDGGKPDRYFFKLDELRATIEQVCAPLVEALNVAHEITQCDYELADACDKISFALAQYRTLIGDKE